MADEEPSYPRPTETVPTTPKLPRSRAVWVALACVLTAVVVASTPVTASAQEGEIRGNALRVFLDCNTFPCDSEYFRTEISFVNWVRDRTLAHVHLIITGEQTGGGGRAFRLDFIGVDGLEGQDDQLGLTTLSSDTDDEVLSGLTQVIGVGLARFSTLIGQPTVFEISASEPAETQALVAADQVDDPWDFWVFELGADLDLDGEETEKSRRNSGYVQARRTTETWKFSLDARGNFSRDEREREDGSSIIDDRTNWNAGSLLAYAIADHWSLGLITGAGASTRRNQDFGADVATAVEYSFFPYEDAPRQSLTARYDVGLQYFDWEEETVFFETSELRPQHQLQLQLFQRQPWGESRVSLNGSQFLHDVGLWSVSFSGDIEFRIRRGLNLELDGGVRFIEDQIFLSREGLTDEEILLGRFERPTNYTYDFSIGLSFEFGSIYNNVVNNRFDRRRGRFF